MSIAARHPLPGPTRAPVMTLPAAEADLLRAAYAKARVILEYGSGGSTEVAARLAEKTVFSVESNVDWLAGMRAWFRAQPPLGRVELHHADIGRVGNWGYPVDAAHIRDWPRYPLSVWDRADFVAPDVVLIDGRFRPACFLAVLFRSPRPVTVLWDDYRNRPQYHFVEDYCPLTGMVGRMAIFDVVPAAVPAEKLGQILTTFLRPQ